jgi:hypothetical protein
VLQAVAEFLVTATAMKQLLAATHSRDSQSIYLLLTAIGLMPGDSVYKDKVHDHPQYNTVHEHYKTQETENT